MKQLRTFPRATALAATMGIVVAAISGCSVSSETKGFANEAMCVSSSGAIQGLKGGGAGARAAASLIRDNAKDAKVRDMAERVVKGDKDKALRDDLSAWLKKACQ